MADEKVVTNWLDEEEKNYGGGQAGVGIIGKIVVSLGFKFFATGHKDDTSFFPYKAGDKASADKAKADAVKAGEAAGASKPPSLAVQIKALKSQVIAVGKEGGKGENWQGDRTFTVPTWTDDYKKLIKPSLLKADLPSLPQEFWGRIGFAPSPVRTKKDDEGNEVAEFVAIIGEVYPTQAAAEKAAGELVTHSGAAQTTTDEVVAGWNDSLIEGGWDKTTWKSMIPDFKKAYDSGKKLPEIARDFSVPVPNVKAALGI